MTLNLNLVRGYVSSTLAKAPTLRDQALSGVIYSQIIDFQGDIKVSGHREHSFFSNRSGHIAKPAKAIRFSPYGYWRDLLTSIRRIFTGVVFPPVGSTEDLQVYLSQGRRVTVYCAIDGSEANMEVEGDQKSLLARIGDSFRRLLC